MRRPTPALPHALLLTALLASLLALLPALPASAAVAPAGREEIDLRASDGVTLRATYWSPGKPGPGVILLHMCNSDRTAWAGLGPRLAAQGLHALALDYRGYGESEGERPTEIEAIRAERAKWPGDVDRAFEALRERTGLETPIFGAAGGSCGVHQSVQLALRHPEVRTLVLLAGNTDRAGEDFLAANPWLPLFGVAAHDDGNAVETMQWLLGFSSHRGNRMAEYDDGGHGTEIFAVHDGLEPVIADWFETHLVTRPVEPTAGAAEPGPSARLRNRLLEPGGVEAIRAAHATGEGEVPPEGVLNQLGYQQLAADETAEAIELFELAVALYPDSANVYDSLADGYLAAGRRDDALRETRKALARLPEDPADDTAGQEAIRQAAEAKLEQLATPDGPAPGAGGG